MLFQAISFFICSSQASHTQKHIFSKHIIKIVLHFCFLSKCIATQGNNVIPRTIWDMHFTLYYAINLVTPCKLRDRVHAISSAKPIHKVRMDSLLFIKYCSFMFRNPGHILHQQRRLVYVINFSTNKINCRWRTMWTRDNILLSNWTLQSQHLCVAFFSPPQPIYQQLYAMFVITGYMLPINYPNKKETEI